MLTFTDNPPALTTGAQTVAELPGHWHVVNCCPRHEKAIAWQAAEAGIGHYLPLVEREHKIGRKRQRNVTTIQPIWAGMLFLCPDLPVDDAYYAIRNLPLVTRAFHVKYQERFVSELDNLRDAIKRDRRYGENSAIARGSLVRILQGAFRGGEHYVESVRGPRVQVVMPLFGRETTVEFDRSELEAVA